LRKFYYTRFLLAILVAVMLLMTGIPFSVLAQEPGENLSATGGQTIDFVREKSYFSYYDENKDKTRPSEAVALKADSMTDSKGVTLLDQHQGRENVLSFAEEGGWVEFTADVPAGIYHLELQYIATEGNHTDLEVGVKIDGSFPFDDAQVVTLTRIWRDHSKISQDEDGNDILPGQEEVCDWVAQKLFNRQGFYNEPYIFSFTEGRHTVQIELPQGNLLLAGARLCNDSATISYEEYAKQYQGKPLGETLTVQAEETYRKSHSTLYPTADRSSSLTVPADPAKLKYNTIGQSNFSAQGQWMEWQIKVTKPGLYNIAFRARQDITRGITSRRRIYIDGEMLFKELDNIEFPYSTGFYYKTLGDDTPYAIYLDEGDHIIRMEVVAPEVSLAMRAVNDAVFELNTIYRQLMIIVGPTPDNFRDYHVDKEIPDLIDRMTRLSKALKDQQAYLDELAGSQSASTGDLQQMAIMLDSMIDKPETIPFRINTFQSNISSLSAWVSSVSAQPLELDSIKLTPAGESPGKAEASFIANIFFGIRAVIGSFFQSYSSLGGTASADSINVWVGLGRDQAQIIKQMTDSQFTPKTGIKVKLSLVQGSILEATLAGKGPDVSLFVADGLPMNLAARGALEGLSKYEPLEEISKTFNEGAMTPYIMREDYYGVPLTQSFPVMFYRKDVLSELGIEKLPETWEDLYEIIPIIQRANLSVGMGDTNVIQYGVNQAPNFGFVFPSLVLQRGGGFYKDDLSATRFDEELVVQAFCDWTEMYTQHSQLLEYDLFNRFRTGEMPIAFSAYTTYNQIAFGAPEIKGLWGIAPVPGTRDEAGNIHREVAASGSSGAVVFKNAKSPDKCFTFLKWITSDEMQVMYGRNIEALMGPAARYDTANKNALKELPWSVNEYRILSEQRATVKEVPVIPATYFVNREVTNAFRRVVLQNQNPRETLILFNRSINKEIKRKNEELQRLQLD